VYRQPPAPLDDGALARFADVVRSGPAVGLLEEEGSGTLRFDRLRSESDLGSWLRRAASARRCGVYPADPGADALSATVVAASP
jgi:hypothetical protein